MNCLITINRHTIAVLSLFFLLGLAACGDSGSSSESINEDYTEDDSSENDDTVLDSKEYTDSSAIEWVKDSSDKCDYTKFGQKHYIGDTLYICEDSTWRRAEPRDYHDCNKSKLAETVVFEGKTYVCRDSEKWSKLTDNEVMFGVCTSLQLGKLDTLYHATGNREEYFVCDTSFGLSDYPAYWRTARIGDYYKCDESNMYKVVRYNEQQVYGCNKKLQWEQVAYPVSSIGYCYEEIRNTIKVTYLNFSYICDTVWRSATIDEGLGACTAAREGERAPFNIYYYICQKGSWEQIEELEYYLGICDSSTREKIAVKEDSVHYVCRASGWVETSMP